MACYCLRTLRDEQHKAKKVWEFGDFQTPTTLALEVTNVVHKLGVTPNSVLEPTCGRGAFLLAACKIFSKASKFVGYDINTEHLVYLKERIALEKCNVPIEIINGDFFDLNWSAIINKLDDPLLIIGNPPWVTSSDLGLLKSSNLPQKSNFQGKRGYDALTGKSNFDISEWMLLQHLEWLQERSGIIAMLCKTSVARKIIIHVWQYKHRVNRVQIYKIDTTKYFNASVDACLFVLLIGDGELAKDCEIFDNLSAQKPSQIIGYHDNTLVANVIDYEHWLHLRGTDSVYTWRSGLKHDSSNVMELEREGDKFRNGYGNVYSLEQDWVFPLLKSSDVGNGRTSTCRKYVIVTQRYVGEDTTHLEFDAPKIWSYLQSYREYLSKRSSSIYRNRPEFSVFGVGEYTFAPWKVAISGFYKTLNFVEVSPINGHPVVFDDTVYFLSCDSKSEASFLAAMLNSQPAQEFLASMIFWSDKRPITIELLKRLNLRTLAKILGREKEYNSYAVKKGSVTGKGLRMVK
ncbi:N-6 DNA methylase [Iningainema tapete]|uniref:SAM-dependent DNA methyltransferase n=1 Tax=Iningainema tapete BLCC-T55 TaxID=2748662 RepID=A0A8J6XMI7_9CYAN|nr:N-6 DNA methylase [Iningainema tapete]MBD2773122.1 SAM-dependent DNA methyltransferase [Iningainema tapete BLCC-T55]